MNTELADKDIEIGQQEAFNNEVNDTIYNLQDRLYEASDWEAVEKVTEKLSAAAGELSAGYKALDKMWTQRGQLEQELNGLDEENWIAELKLESDGVKEYVKRYGEEITKEQAKITAAAGTEDEDLVTGVSNAVIAWYQTRLTEKEAEGVWRLSDYRLARKNRDQQIQR